jgi:ATP-dependent DNA helicase RecQ
MGFLQQNSGQFPTVGLTAEGLAALKDRRRIPLTRPMEKPRTRSHRAGEIECDELLFEKLRMLRRRLAEEQGVPPYIVFGDVTLRTMARDYPETASEMHAVTGVGEAKFRAYGEAFLTEIRDHLRANPKRRFAG